MYRLGRPGIIRPGLLLIFLSYLLSASCVSTKRVVYFSDLPDTISSSAPVVMTQIATFVDPKIESSDNLAVTIQTITQNDKTNAPITSNTTSTFNALNGFLVDRSGYIELPLIGFVKVAGLTTSEARELVKQKAKEFYKDPVVNVRIANFDITVLGDVTKPGILTLPSEKTTILDVIAMSGDLSLTARRDNILLVRTENNEKKFVRFDMRSTKIFQSPYYYIKQRDIVYVEPNKSKVQTSDNTFIRNLGIISSLISLASLIVVFRSIK